MSTPIRVQWDAEHEVFRPRNPQLCSTRFTDEEIYRCDFVEERSIASHNQYFAAIHDKWLSLPDDLATEFPTEEHLRKRALIMCGYRRERKFVASSPAEARKIAAFLRPVGIDDDYAIISVHGDVVVEWRAMSQSRQAMPEKGQFQRSKQAVLDWIDDLLGIKSEAEAA